MIAAIEVYSKESKHLKEWIQKTIEEVINNEVSSNKDNYDQPMKCLRFLEIIFNVNRFIGHIRVYTATWPVPVTVHVINEGDIFRSHQILQLLFFLDS